MTMDFKLLALIASSALLTAAQPAAAGVYKCMEDGKLVYSDRMCDAQSTPLNTKQSLGGTNARRYTYGDSRREPGTRRTREDRGEPVRGPTVIDRTDPETLRRCDELKKLKARLARSGRPLSTGEAEQLEELEFSRCYGHVNGNQ